MPWFTGGHTDPWDHVENAMALTVAGLRDAARAAYEWSPNDAARRRFVADPDRATVSSRTPTRDTNFCAYLATGVLAPRAGHR